ncbi:MAG TPA: hypothetical protein VFM87_05420, partial [Agrococcus sp.]|nr:hypothetical protein [Agrococcus sp.]
QHADRGRALREDLARPVDGGRLELRMGHGCVDRAGREGPVRVVLAGEATRLAYGTDEAVEGRDSFLEKREPDWSPYPWHY